VEGEEKIAYGDNQGYLHILKKKGRGYVEQWRSRDLGGSIAEVFIRDIDADSLLELVTYTSRGRIFIFDLRSYAVMWQSSESFFTNISSMSIEDVDEDPYLEIIFCADSHLYVYDGKSLFEQWRSEEEFQAQDILIADVDGDGQKEIVLNTGWVLDAKFHDIEWQSPEPFGERLGLLDVDDDGIPELLGEFSGGFLKIWDIDLKREKW